MIPVRRVVVDFGPVAPVVIFRDGRGPTCATWWAGDVFLGLCVVGVA